MDEIYVEDEEYIDLLMAKKAVERVRKLHLNIPNVCVICRDAYPCRTIRILDGEQL